VFCMLHCISLQDFGHSTAARSTTVTSICWPDAIQALRQRSQAYCCFINRFQAHSKPDKLRRTTPIGPVTLQTWADSL
jgi:hypothetical protein